jgi:hypothetical protein
MMEKRGFSQHPGAQINTSLGLPLAGKGFTIDSGEAMSNPFAQHQPRARAQASNCAANPTGHFHGYLCFSPILNTLKSSSNTNHRGFESGGFPRIFLVLFVVIRFLFVAIRDYKCFRGYYV